LCAPYNFIANVVQRLPIRIYLVEDNAVIRENLSATLVELANATVCGDADNEDDALSWLRTRTNEWDIAVVDLFLKQGNGMGVVAACKNRRSAQKVVVLSNYASPGIREQCLRLGADAVFDKSNDIDNLVAFCLKQNVVH
jgi:two-component system, OmpR family, response regulator